MVGRAGLVVAGFALACAHTPETVVHVSAPHEARWEVRAEDGEHVCFVPCNVELDEHELVTVARTDGRTRFVLRQADLGSGAFSASVRARPVRSNGPLAARIFGAALSGAGSVLARSGDEEHLAAGVVLSGMGAAATALGEASRRERDELWVERAATR